MSVCTSSSIITSSIISITKPGTGRDAGKFLKNFGIQECKDRKKMYPPITLTKEIKLIKVKIIGEKFKHYSLNKRDLLFVKLHFRGQNQLHSIVFFSSLF